MACCWGEQWWWLWWVVRFVEWGYGAPCVCVALLWEKRDQVGWLARRWKMADGICKRWLRFTWTDHKWECLSRWEGELTKRQTPCHEGQPQMRTGQCGGNEMRWDSCYVSSGFCALNPGGKKFTWQLRHHMFMFRSFITWLKSCLIVWTPCLLKVFFWLNRTTYCWWHWFPFFNLMLQITLTCICYMWHRPLIFAGVYSSCDAGWEASKASKVHVQFQGFYDLTFFWLYYATTMFVKDFFLLYVATYYWLYWFLFFCNFFLCMLWNTSRCMHCTWHQPLIFTGVYGSCDTDSERPWRCSKFTCIFRGFMIQHLFGCIMWTQCLFLKIGWIEQHTIKCIDSHFFAVLPFACHGPHRHAFVAHDIEHISL